MLALLVIMMPWGLERSEAVDAATPAPLVRVIAGGGEGYGQYIHTSGPIYVTNQRLLIPLADLSERFQYHVTWDQEHGQMQIQQGRQVIQIQIGAAEAKHNGNPVAVEAPARTIEGVTYVPLRLIHESLGKYVYYLPEFNGEPTVWITDRPLLQEKDVLSLDDDPNFERLPDDPTECQRRLLPQGKTPRQIQLGATMADVRQAYGTPYKMETAENEQTRWEYHSFFLPHSGYAWVYEFTFTQDQLTQLCVSLPH